MKNWTKPELNQLGVDATQAGTTGNGFDNQLIRNKEDGDQTWGTSGPFDGDQYDKVN